MGRGPIPYGSYCELRDAPHIILATFAAKYWAIGRDRVPAMVRDGKFPVPVIVTGQGRICTKTALLQSMGITPDDLLTLAAMEENSKATPPQESDIFDDED